MRRKLGALALALALALTLAGLASGYAGAAPGRLTLAARADLAPESPRQGGRPLPAPNGTLVLAQAASVGETAGNIPADGAAAPAAASTAAEPAWRHATALTGEPRYPRGFPHFGYVDPAAPKGGRVRLASPQGFDSFNPVRSRDSAAPGLPLMVEPLMEPAIDEQNISAQYGLIAEAVRFPDDFSWVEYRVDPRARWHDGTPITAEDVAWSLEAARKVDPNRAFYYGDVARTVVVDPHVVRFEFARAGNRELPQILGQLLVLPKAWWTAEGRSIERGTLTPPMGSGPYRIARFEAGRFVEYERVPDYWGATHPTQVGSNNFDTIRYDVYRDSNIAVEALKGDRVDFRQENSAKNWVFSYDFPALARGDVVREEFPQQATASMQAFVMNLRLPKFQDQRVRRALNLMYDFEAQKSSVFYDLYHRTTSFFDGTELASSGLPEGQELEILDSVRDLVPPSVFTTPYQNPVGGTPQAARDNARQAVALFRQAGYEIRGDRMVEAATGTPFTIDFISDMPTADRYVLPYKESLRRIGVELDFRLVEPAQHDAMQRDRNFEMLVAVWGQSLSPGNEQAYFWGSAAADQPTSENIAGIKDAGVDALIERVILAKDRAELVAATKALDRVLLAHDYVVPLFSSGMARTVRWNRFGHPANIPPYGASFPTIWWWDAAKAAALGSRP